MIKQIASLSCVIIILSSTADSNESDLGALLNEIQSLQFPPLQLSYIDNINAIASTEQLSKQQHVLEKIQNQLTDINYKDLPKLQQRDVDLLQYELTLSFERIALEKKWLADPKRTLSVQGLSDTTYGKAWYQHFLKRWVDLTVTPEMLMVFGEAEVRRVHQRMLDAEKAVQRTLAKGNQNLEQTRFFLNDIDAVHAAFIEEKKHISQQVEHCFPFINEIPDIAIKAGTNPNLAQTPGYYSINQFSYNYFDKPFNIRQIAWLYLHEAIPGHHYQVSLESKLPMSMAQAAFNYRGYREGWAAYVEELGNDCGFYNEPLDELGKWEWDIVRSVRIVLDIGLNYYDWSDQKALQYWQQYIKRKDDIAQREIARMKRWPAQVITYKYGANALLKIKQKNNITTKAELKKYHETLMRLGPMPFSLLEKAFDAHG
jgi:uncharacterized protein (DUF885 family)